MTNNIIRRIKDNRTPLETVCEKCKDHKEVPYFEIKDGLMCIYYCESCGKELTEATN